MAKLTRRATSPRRVPTGSTPSAPAISERSVCRCRPRRPLSRATAPSHRRQRVRSRRHHGYAAGRHPLCSRRRARHACRRCSGHRRTRLGRRRHRGGSLGPIEDAVTALAAAGTVVVRASRVGEGRVIRDDNWQKPGMVAADNLSAHKAALLLSLALTRTSSPDEIQTMFDRY